MPVKVKITEKRNTPKLKAILNMPKMSIRVGTNTNYGVSNSFDVFGLSDVLENGANAGRNGSVHIPGWKYNEKAFEKFKPKAKDLYLQGVHRVINGRFTIDGMLNQIGIEAAEGYKQTVEEIKSPANAPATIAKKGFNNPMIDTGYFKFNISAQINGGRVVR